MSSGEIGSPSHGVVAVSTAGVCAGSGEDVVFLPGMAVHRYLRPTRDLVARHARAHVVHLPGTGQAPDPPRRSVGLAEDVAATVDWLEADPHVGPVVLVGHSYGCQVADRVAAALPDRVTRPPGGAGGCRQGVLAVMTPGRIANVCLSGSPVKAYLPRRGRRRRRSGR